MVSAILSLLLGGFVHSLPSMGRKLRSLLLPVARSWVSDIFSALFSRPVSLKLYSVSQGLPPRLPELTGSHFSPVSSPGLPSLLRSTSLLWGKRRAICSP